MTNAIKAHIQERIETLSNRFRGTPDSIFMNTGSARLDELTMLLQVIENLERLSSLATEQSAEK